MKNFITILSIFVCFNLQAQKILNLKSDKSSFRQKKDSSWTHFSEWDYKTIKIKIQADKDTNKYGKIIIFDNPKQEYKIVSEISNTDSVFRLITKIVKANSQTLNYTNDLTTKDIISFNCQDTDKNNCYVFMLGKGSSIYLIVYYLDYNICYNVIED